jgi:hypothetical protein
MPPDISSNIDMLHKIDAKLKRQRDLASQDIIEQYRTLLNGYINLELMSIDEGVSRLMELISWRSRDIVTRY